MLLPAALMILVFMAAPIGAETVYIYKGRIYDPRIRYFGPQGSWISKLIPTYPPGLDVLAPAWNKVAFKHDVDYSGKWPWYRRLYYFALRIDSGRAAADKNFHAGLVASIDHAVKIGKINNNQAAAAYCYARLAFTAVDKGGALFYKKGDLKNA